MPNLVTGLDSSEEATEDDLSSLSSLPAGFLTAGFSLLTGLFSDLLDLSLSDEVVLDLTGLFFEASASLEVEVESLFRNRSSVSEES